MADLRSFFRRWCMRRNLTPRFDVTTGGTIESPMFTCELQVPGFDHTGKGESNNGKDAQIFAVNNYIEFLIKTHMLDHDEIPYHNLKEPEKWGASDDSEEDEDYACQDDDEEEEEEEKYSMDETCGNWTIENAKPKLHQFLQLYKIKANFNYSLNGNRHVAKMDVPVPHLDNTIISGMGEGEDEKEAAKVCALEIVKQLYRERIFEAFSGSFKKTMDLHAIAHEVSLEPALEDKLLDLMNRLGIKSVLDDQEKCSSSGDEPISLVSDAVLYEMEDLKSEPAQVVTWSLPEPNWHTWKSTPIDEGSLAKASMEDTSSDLVSDLKMMREDEKVMSLMEKRKQLPIYALKDSIMNAVSQHPVVIIKGDTGSGKTTQVCQMILDSEIERGRGAYCNIAVCEPRMLWAMMAADRVAAERGEEIGITASISTGYSLRFESSLPRPHGSIMFTTPGVLLRRMANGLKGVSHVIVDEVQERDMNSDFLVAVLRDMIRAYPEFRVVLLTSSTHEGSALFSSYFDDCPVIDVPVVIHPVEVYYLEDCIEMLGFEPKLVKRRTKKDFKNSMKRKKGQPIEGENILNCTVGPGYSQRTHDVLGLINSNEICFDLLEEILAHCKAKDIEGAAALIFLPSLHVIKVILKRLEKSRRFRNTSYIFCPLHHELPIEEQKLAFEPVPEGFMKVILTTDMAENCIMVDEVVFVIDACKSKTKRIILEDNTVEMLTRWSHKDKLEQRKNRAGRLRPGFCYRLCTKANFETLDNPKLIPPAEILRSSLHELALMVKHIKLGHIGEFFMKLVEPPRLSAVIHAQNILSDLNCLDHNGELNSLGRLLVKIPVDPKFGKSLLLGCIFNVGDAISTLTANAATLPAVVDIDRKLGGNHRVFGGGRCSDHTTMMNILENWIDHSEKGLQQELKFIKDNELSFLALRTTLSVKRRLCEMLAETGFADECLKPTAYEYNDLDGNLDMVAGLLCAALYPNVCYHKEKRKILTTGSVPSLIHKTSINCTLFETGFDSPFFIFGLKRKSRLVVCSYTTKVTALHLLLFGSRSVQLINGRIRLDSWINLKMKPKVAEAILALRPALESIVMRVSRDPSIIQSLPELDREVIDTIRKLCLINTGRYALDKYSMKRIKRPYNLVEKKKNSKKMKQKIKKMKRMMDGPGGSGPTGGFGHRGGGGNRGNFNNQFRHNSQSQWKPRGGRGGSWRGGRSMGMGDSGYGRGEQAPGGGGQWRRGNSQAAPTQSWNYPAQNQQSGFFSGRGRGRGGFSRGGGFSGNSGY